MTDHMNRHRIYPAGDHPTTQPGETPASNARQQYLDGYRDGYNRAVREKATKPLPENAYSIQPVMCSLCGKVLNMEARMAYSIENHPACKECFYRKVNEYGPLREIVILPQGE